MNAGNPGGGIVNGGSIGGKPIGGGNVVMLGGSPGTGGMDTVGGIDTAGGMDTAVGMDTAGGKETVEGMGGGIPAIIAGGSNGADPMIPGELVPVDGGS